MSTTTTDLAGIVAAHIAAVNAQDEDAIVATFADDALVNDAHREFWGTDAIRRWVAKELVDPHARGHRGARAPGRDDRPRPLRRRIRQANLPEEVILTNYFTVRDGKIVSLIVIRNSPAY